MTTFLIIAAVAIAVIIIFENRRCTTLQHSILDQILELRELIEIQRIKAAEKTLDAMERADNAAVKAKEINEKNESFHKTLIAKLDILDAKLAALNGHEQMIIKEVQELKTDEQLVTKLRQKKK